MTTAKAKQLAVKAQAPLEPSAILEKAVSGGADVAVIEKLMDLERQWHSDQARKSYNVAIAHARSEIPVILKTQEKTGAGGSYKYEDLASIARAIDPVLAKHDLSYRYKSESNNGSVKVTCVISHVDGHSEENSLTANLDMSGSKNPIQALGSAVTYLQRYTLKLALGIASSKDDDGSSVPRQDVSSVVLGDDRHTLNKADSRPVYKELIEEMRAIDGIREIEKWSLESSPRIYSMHRDAVNFFLEEYREYKEQLRNPPVKEALKASLEAEDTETEELL